MADDIVNNLDGTSDTTREAMNLTVPTTGSTTIFVTPQGDDGKSGCNIQGTTASVTFSVTSSNTGVATVSPSSITFDDCGDQIPVTVTPHGTVSGSANITFLETANTTAGSWNVAPANFTVNVTPSVSDSTAPGNRLITINDGAAWSNDADGDVTVDISATDAVGVTSYRLAETQAGLATATATAVSPATSFSASDLAFALTGDEATSKSVWVRFCDAANNCADASDTIGWDHTAPTITDDGPTAGPNGQNGWYTTAVTNEFSASDTVSGLGTTCNAAFPKSPSSGTAEGSAVTIPSGACTDIAGNTNNGINSAAFMIDLTAPTGVATTLNRAADHNGWYNAAVGWTTNGTDATSGIASCDSGTYSTPDGQNLTVSGSCTDNAGNQSASATSAAFKFDDTNPANVATTLNRAADHNGWYNAAVGWTTTGTDATSGIASCDTGTYSTPDGQNLTVTGSCTDNAGNSASDASPAFDFDNTDPTGVTTTLDRPADHNGWYNAAVGWTTNGTDATSGIASCDSGTYSGPEGNPLSVSGSCTDNAGNVSAPDAVSFKLDLTNPLVDITSPTGGSTIATKVTVSGTDSDALSGIEGVTVNGTAATLTSGGFTRADVPLGCGANTITAIATDNAGLTSSDSVTLTRACFGIQYLQPLDQSTTAPVMNQGKYGRVIPVKVLLSLQSGGGLTQADLTANGWTLQIGVNGATCSNGVAADAVEAYADAGTSNGGTNVFRYDATAGQWIYNLDTKAAPGMAMAIGKCYRLDAYISDGTNKVLVSGSPYALFQPVK